MNKEDYVSLEVAKILKEKGYDESCDKYVEKIEGSEREEWDDGELMYCTVWDVATFPKPTLYEAQKWLRIKHRVSITPYYVGNDKYTYHLVRMNCAYNYCNNNNIYDTYEEALNEGIKEALELV